MAQQVARREGLVTIFAARKNDLARSWCTQSQCMSLKLQTQAMPSTEGGMRGVLNHDPWEPSRALAGAKVPSMEQFGHSEV